MPPTLNLEEIDGDASMLDHVQTTRDQSNVKRRCNDEVGIQVALSNSFGFGGTNASLCFKKAT